MAGTRIRRRLIGREKSALNRYGEDGTAGSRHPYLDTRTPATPGRNCAATDYRRITSLPWSATRETEAVWIAIRFAENFRHDGEDSEGRVLAITSRTACEDSPLNATPTTTAQKRMPDRTLSTDFRIIPDLRYANLFCLKEEYPELKMTDIEQIAEKQSQQKWDGRKCQCCAINVISTQPSSESGYTQT